MIADHEPSASMSTCMRNKPVTLCLPCIGTYFTAPFRSRALAFLILFCKQPTWNPLKNFLLNEYSFTIRCQMASQATNAEPDKKACALPTLPPNAPSHDQEPTTQPNSQSTTDTRRGPWSRILKRKVQKSFKVLCKIVAVTITIGALWAQLQGNGFIRESNRIDKNQLRLDIWNSCLDHQVCDGPCREDM